MSANDQRILPPGKVPGDVLGPLLAKFTRPDPSIVVGPGIGRDAAALRTSGNLIVVKTDPITFPTVDAGRYLININANDIACMGATPRWLLVTALLPEGKTTPALIESLFSSLTTAADELGILLVGGHSEITQGVDRPLLIGQMIGEATDDDLLDIGNAQDGDLVVLIGGIAVEGTAILATQAAEALAGIDPDLFTRAGRFLTTPGISVVPAARALQASGAMVRGMHDPTEGGLATALPELSAATGLGLEVDLDAIPIYPETQAICDALGLDPLGLISSGALLAVVAPDRRDSWLHAVQEAGFIISVVGRLTASHTRVETTTGTALPVFAVDELARYFSL